MKTNAHVFFPTATVSSNAFSDNSDDKQFRKFHGKVECEGVVKGNRVFDLYLNDGTIVYDIPMTPGIMFMAPEIN